MNFSAFADCNSETVVMRMPYAFAATLIKNCPPSQERAELIRWLKMAATRSKKFSQIVDEMDEAIAQREQPLF